MTDEAEKDAYQEEYHGSVQPGTELQRARYSIAHDSVTEERNSGGA